MIVDCEAYARTCVHCNQTKSMNHENLAEYFYDDTDVRDIRWYWKPLYILSWSWSYGSWIYNYLWN